MILIQNPLDLLTDVFDKWEYSFKRFKRVPCNQKDLCYNMNNAIEKYLSIFLNAGLQYFFPHFHNLTCFLSIRSSFAADVLVDALGTWR